MSALYVSEVTLQNYRCFDRANSARVKIGDGFTALIGPNNSGKSTFLRFFFDFRQLFQSLELNILIQALTNRPQVFPPARGVNSPRELFHNLNEEGITIVLELTPDSEDINRATTKVESVEINVPRDSNTWSARLKIGGAGWLDPPESIGMDGHLCVYPNGVRVDVDGVVDAIRELGQTLYVPAFRNAINIGSNETFFDIRTGQAFIAEWRRLKTGSNPVENESILSLTRDIQSIFGLEQLEINPSEDGETLQLTINNKSYRLRDVGSGIAQFVLVLANAAVSKPAYLLLDEPELNLHPSLQLDFLTTLAAHTSRGVIFTTHSIGLARSVGERIFSVRLENGRSLVNDLEREPSLVEFLGEISFSGYQELGCSKVLLVEGRTDVKTLQQFLRKYRKEQDVVLLPLGGNTLISPEALAELGEVRRITEDLHVLIDSERSGAGELEKSRKEFADGCRDLGIDCHVLDWRAIENYLTDTAVKKVKGDKYRALGPYEKRESVTPMWGKAENWRIAREMSIEDLAATDLGPFLSGI